MRKALGISTALTLSWLGAARAQYEDLVDLPDAPTRTQEEQGIICTIEGVQFIKKDVTTEKGAKEYSVVYLLTEKPSAYFNYYDEVKKALVFDFYDTHIGESIMEPIREPPITNSTVEQFKIDLNKDVAGLREDVRDVVRVSLFTPYDFDYEVMEDYGVITMSFKWSKSIERKFKRQIAAFYWQFPLALAILGGGGYWACTEYLDICQPKPKAVDPLPCCPGHPDAAAASAP